MARTRFEIETDGQSRVVTIVARDYILANQAIKAEGNDPAEVYAFEYRCRVAFEALKRIGDLPEDADLMEWLGTVEDVDTPADAEGE